MSRLEVESPSVVVRQSARPPAPPLRAAKYGVASPDLVAAPHPNAVRHLDLDHARCSGLRPGWGEGNVGHRRLGPDSWFKDHTTCRAAPCGPDLDVRDSIPA
jgi:hypothetical protein